MQRLIVTRRQAATMSCAPGLLQVSWLLLLGLILHPTSVVGWPQYDILAKHLSILKLLNWWIFLGHGITRLWGSEIFSYN